MDQGAIRKSIESRSEQAVAEKVFPGCVVGFINRKGARMTVSSGRLAYASHAALAREDTLYDLASVTKSIPTASLALSFIADGGLSLTDLVSSYVSELRNDHGATIEDLLRYRVHGIQLSRLRVRTFEEVRTHALERGFDEASGESIYTNLPAFILGLVLERVGGTSIAELAHRYFFEPLSMYSTTFFPAASDCAPTEIDDLRGPASAPPSSKTTDGHGKTSAGKEVRGLPHDESAYLFAIARRSAGHAGLFSTASDLLLFLEALLSDRYPSVTEGASQGLGWQVKGAFLGSDSGAGSYGKTGFTGTSIMIDPVRGFASVILSNRTYPKRPLDSVAINAFRRDIADIFQRMVE